ncbi:MAG: hypothetical protein AAB588_04575 [Patescibacteria group bacterium]
MNDPLFFIFLAIIGLFIFLLSIKSQRRWKFCVLCASVGITWMTLLVLYWTGIFNNAVLLSLLIGNSIVGGYYAVEKKVPEKFHIFRLPFFLTLLFIGYELVTAAALSQTLLVILLLAASWLTVGILAVYRHNPSFKKTLSALIECCKDW